MQMARLRGIFITPDASSDHIAVPSSGYMCMSFNEFQTTLPALREVQDVSCWLFCPTYDAFDVLRLLTQNKYQNALTCYFHALARPEMIQMELTQGFPNIEITLLQTDTADTAVLNHLSSIMLNGPV